MPTVFPIPLTYPKVVPKSEAESSSPVGSPGANVYPASTVNVSAPTATTPIAKALATPTPGTPINVSSLTDIKGPRTDALAKALIEGSNTKPRSAIETLGNLGQFWAGTGEQREYEARAAEEAQLPTKQIQEYVAGGGDLSDAEAMISTGSKPLVDLGVELLTTRSKIAAEAAAKPPEFTEVDGDLLELPRTSGGEVRPVYETPEGVREFTPEEAAELYPAGVPPNVKMDLKTNLPVELPTGPGASTEVGKIYEDVANGIYGPEVAQELLNKELARYERLDTPEKREAAGINPNDQSPWYMSPEGKPERIEVPATFEDWTDEETGDVWKRNTVTNELSRVAEGDTAKLPTGYRWIDPEHTKAEQIPGVKPKHIGGGNQIVKLPGGDEQLTVGQIEVDKAYAKEYLEWRQGGAADAAIQLSQLEDAARRLGTEQGISGPVIGLIPEFALSIAAPDAVEVRDEVFQVAARSLKAILGAQFAVAENLQFVSRAYNPALSQEENARRVWRLMSQIRAMTAAKSAAAEYFQLYGTLKDWNHPLPSISDVNPDVPIPGEVFQLADGRWVKFKGGPSDADDSYELTRDPNDPNASDPNDPNSMVPR